MNVVGAQRHKSKMQSAFNIILVSDNVGWNQHIKPNKKEEIKENPHTIVSINKFYMAEHTEVGFLVSTNLHKI